MRSVHIYRRYPNYALLMFCSGGSRFKKKRGRTYMIFFPKFSTGLQGAITIIMNKVKSVHLVKSFCNCNCMFYQLLRVQHSCSSTQSLGSVLPSVETRIPGVAPFSLAKDTYIMQKK